MSEAKDLLIKARVQLQTQNPFFSYVCMHLTLREDDRVPTMGVDKYGNCYYNKKFVMSLVDKQRADVEKVKGVLCHEIMHVILDHLKRLGGRDSEISNVAQDLVVNDMLITNHFDLPECGLLPRNHCMKISDGNKVVGEIKDINKKVWEEVYEELLKHAKKVSKWGFGDQHIRDPKEGDGQGSGQEREGQGKQIKITEGKGSKPEDKGTDPTQGTSEKEKDWKQIVNEAYTYAKMQGKTPAGMDRYIEELNTPKLNWRQLLQKFIVQQIPYDFTYSRPSKKSMVTGVYMPAIRKEQLEIAVAVDTSGSMSDVDLQDCLSEVIGIVSAYENVDLTVLACDAHVHSSSQVQTIRDVSSIKLQGGGGTDFKPVFQWLNEHKPNLRLLVFFTDGYGDFPEESSINTLWVLSNTSMDLEDIPFGDAVKIDRREGR